jgi:hypothetical protein
MAFSLTGNNIYKNMSSPDSSKVCSQTAMEVIPFQILSASPVDLTQREGE